MKSTGRKSFLFIWTFLLLFAVLPAAKTAAKTKPVIALTSVPAYGETSYVKGVVYTEDGSSFKASKYRISLYLQLSENGTYWVKPTYDQPYATVSGSGAFSVQYATGGYDIEALILHIMLIPSSYTPDSNFEATRQKAVDYVKVTRTKKGGITVDPERTPGQKKITKEFSSGLKVSKKKIAVNVGFYQEGNPNYGSPVTKTAIKKQLNAVKKYADTVRFYSSTGDVAAAYKIAHDMGFKVVGTAWLSGKDTAADKKELDGLIALCNKGYVQVACVGSETLLRGDLTSSKLIKYIKYVRKNLKKSVRSKVAVTTADDLDKLLANDKVCKACDILAVNNYPFWGGITIKRAVEAFARNIETIQQAYPTKEILISETGWPTAGDTNGKAKPSEKNAAKYFSGVRAWSLKTKTVVLWFDAADEPWKETAEGSVGSHWGLMKKNFKLKSAFKKLAIFK